jgi:hypothetical protein
MTYAKGKAPKIPLQICRQKRLSRQEASNPAVSLDPCIAILRMRLWETDLLDSKKQILATFGACRPGVLQERTSKLP